MSFDEIIERRGTKCAKWDAMQKLYPVPAETGLPMWVADMDFRPPQVVQAALGRMLDHGIYGYFGDHRDYLAAIRWWMQTRHGWDVPEEAVFTTHGLVNAVGLSIQAFTAPGDGVVLMTPVYHAFARTIRAAGRRVVECPLALTGGRYEMDFDRWDGMVEGARMVILCSPHNPGGRVWTQAELRGVADFAKRHDLILMSDEIHHDLVFSGHTHTVMPLAAPDIIDRLVMLTAPSKTFNIAGVHTGQVTVIDPTLRARFAGVMAALGISGNSFGFEMTTAAYSSEGAEWLTALIDYIDGNRAIFDAAIAGIPGLRSMPLEGTYLSWVDFSGTGMSPADFTARVERDAGIAANHGDTFGLGGETYMRFNLGTQRARIQEACARLARAFGDLQ